MNDNIETGYEAFGDVDPITYGGIWIRRTKYLDTYDVIKYCPETREIHDLEISILDDWIDRAGVMKFVGIDNISFDPVAFIQGCVSYYGPDEFGVSYQMTNDNEVIEFLQNRGIEVKQ